MWYFICLYSLYCIYLAGQRVGSLKVVLGIQNLGYNFWVGFDSCQYYPIGPLYHKIHCDYNYVLRKLLWKVSSCKMWQLDTSIKSITVFTQNYAMLSVLVQLNIFCWKSGNSGSVTCQITATYFHFFREKVPPHPSSALPIPPRPSSSLLIPPQPS
jgi:hypothetical protein